MNSGIIFQVETDRILEIISDEIYDSSFAMLRENVQNAYDAIRERFAATGELQEGGRIDIKIEGHKVTISDNGVGMNEEILRNNFWNAGSSGKRSEKARKAGVIGTFGIGAMANFGVCARLSVETRQLDQATILRSTAERSSLKIGEECIEFEKIETQRDFGTTIFVTLDESHPIEKKQAEEYLAPYVGLLPVPVYLNDDLISKKEYRECLPIRNRRFTNIGITEISDATYSAKFAISADTNAQVLVELSKIRVGGHEIDGSIILLQSGGPLMGLRSFFGLAPIPAIGNYQFGGFANLPFLHPTAGREALSRESIEQVAHLINLAEKATSEVISKTKYADQSIAFLTWLNSHSRYDLAGMISIHIFPDDANVTFSDLQNYTQGKKVHFYTGSDKAIINTFSNESACLLQISPNNPRRRLQMHYVQNILKLSPIPDSAQITRVYDGNELEMSEVSILFRIGAILRDDYLVPSVEVKFADISHNVAVLATNFDDQLNVNIARSTPSLAPLREFYENAYELFSQFMVDYVRVNVYPHIQQYVPSSTKGGVDALRVLLMRNKELYRYEESERGDIEGILGDYLSGKSSFKKVLDAARKKNRPQSQKVSAKQVGTIENELPGITESPVVQIEEPGREFNAAPPIIRDAISSKMKILTTNNKFPLLNNFTMFLGMSDKLMKTEGDFFSRPHTTRIIWAGHRVVYIFTEETGKLNLYYDIELKHPIEQSKTGGSMVPTTTLITKHRIFIPIPDMLKEEFHVTSGPKEFFVRFDILGSDLI